MRPWLTVLMLAAVLPGAATARESKTMKPDTALVVIDIQNFYFEGGRLPLSGSIEASLKAKQLIETFRSRGLPVVHVRHVPKEKLGPDGNPTDPQYAFHENVRPKPGEKIVTKQQVNSFRDTDLLAWLKEAGITKLVLAGMQTHMCLEAAARAANDLGFEVTVVRDACATRALKFGDREVPADQVQAAVLATLSGNYARVVSLEEYLHPGP